MEPPNRSQGLEELYERLIGLHLKQQLPGVPLEDESQFSDEEVTRLLSHASVLALSSDQSKRLMAYEIATRLVEMGRDSLPGLVYAVDAVLSRIGNFPGRALLRKRYEFKESASANVPIRLLLESLVRENENTVKIAEGETAILTDFQYDLFQALDDYESLSVSAPTSAGKSYVMSLDLIRRLRSTPTLFVIYIVPTRALIREVTLNVRRELSNHGLSDIPVRSVPFPVLQEQAPRGAVFVLTQERLLSLLHSSRGTQRIDTLIVDEAQNIGGDSRGIILQTAIEAALIRNPQLQLYFASPMSSNPELLLRVFRRDGSGMAFIDRLPPVSQSIVLVSPVKGRPAYADFRAQLPDGTIDLVP